MCRLLVSVFLTEITQQIHSLRARGVIFSHFARASGSEVRTFRKSAGTLCTAPCEIAFLAMDFILYRYSIGLRSSLMQVNAGRASRRITQEQSWRRLVHASRTCRCSLCIPELRKKMGTSAREEYQRLDRAANEARVKSEQARLALEQPIGSQEREDRATASGAFNFNLRMRETVRKEKQCKSGNLGKAIWKSRPSASAAWA